MKIQEVLGEVLKTECPLIHDKRLNAVLDVAEGLRGSCNLSLTAIGRRLSGNAKIKHKIKKVDRCLGNEHLYNELHSLYGGLSHFILQKIESSKDKHVVIDLCYLKDDRQIQMLSAQFCTKGMTLPLYQDVFLEGELKDRTNVFLQKLKDIIPQDKKVIIIMDAGFHVEWFKVIKSYGWYWICRIRQGKDLKIDGNWISVKDYIPLVPHITKDQGHVVLTKTHEYSCRLVTTRKELKGRKEKVSRGKITSKAANGTYSNGAREPWILATNLDDDLYKASEIVAIYGKRMQIEEAFRAIKSHQFGLSGRYVRTLNTRRWAILMLIAAIVLISYWVIGVIGHSQGMQKLFQVNTSNERQFSYFTLGKLIIEHNKLGFIAQLEQTLQNAISMELIYV